MRLFLHQDLQRLAGYLDGVRRLGDAYRTRAFDLDDRLEPWLAELEDFFRRRPKSATQSAAFATLRNQLETARRGINPVTRELQKTGRRVLVATTAFAILETATAHLTDAYAEGHRKVEEATQLLQPTLLSALQAGFLATADVEVAKASPDAAGPLWDTMAGRVELRQITQRVLLLVTRQDALLLLFEAVGRL